MDPAVHPDLDYAVVEPASVAQVAKAEPVDPAVSPVSVYSFLPSTRLLILLLMYAVDSDPDPVNHYPLLVLPPCSDGTYLPKLTPWSTYYPAPASGTYP